MTHKANFYDTIIIGAGAAGLFCAIEAGKRGRRVLVLDHANKPGKKILMSGGGRCNFTNLYISPENYLSHNPHFCKSALSRYTQWDFIELVKKHQIAFHEKKHGQLFCDDKSKAILNMLLAECEIAGAEIWLQTSIQSIRRQADGFQLLTNQQTLSCESLVIATGGLSIPTMGASAFAYEVAKQFDIPVHPTTAALVPLTLHEKDKSKLAVLAGISNEACVSHATASFHENILFTHRGLSGPAILQISSYWKPGDALMIDLMPGQPLYEKLITAKQTHPQLKLKNFCYELFAKRMVDVWLDTMDANQTLADFSHQKLQTIANAFQQWQLKPNGTEGYRTAEVTLGGVDCNALSSKTMAAQQVKGLYFIGEAVDVTGWLGGYNFQWAWSSGFAAGQVC